MTYDMRNLPSSRTSTLRPTQFREDAALTIFAQLIAIRPGCDYTSLARRAVIATDALIRALDESQG